MSKEKLPEFPGWKERLEEPGALPEWELKDRPAAWDRLHARLGKKPRRRSAAWYWTAAACLLLLGGAASLFRKSPPAAGISHSHRGTDLPPNRSAGNSTAPAPHPVPGPAAPVLALDPGQKAASSDPADLRKHQRVTGLSKPRLQGITPVRTGSETPSFDILRGPLRPGTPPVIAFRPSLPAPAARKELRVIHVNELDPAPRNGASLARIPSGTASGPFRIRWGNPPSSEESQELPSADRLPNTRTSSLNNILKINLSPQN